MSYHVQALRIMVNGEAVTVHSECAIRTADSHHDSYMVTVRDGEECGICGEPIEGEDEE